MQNSSVTIIHSHVVHLDLIGVMVIGQAKVPAIFDHKGHPISYTTIT